MSKSFVGCIYFFKGGGIYFFIKEDCENDRLTVMCINRERTNIGTLSLNGVKTLINKVLQNNGKAFFQQAKL